MTQVWDVSKFNLTGMLIHVSHVSENVSSQSHSRLHSYTNPHLLIQSFFILIYFVIDLYLFSTSSLVFLNAVKLSVVPIGFHSSTEDRMFLYRPLNCCLKVLTFLFRSTSLKRLLTTVVSRQTGLNKPQHQIKFQK